MSKKARHEVAERALATIGRCPELRVGAVYRQTSARKKAYAVEREATYIGLVDHLDTRLTAAGEHGMIIMDGNGTHSNGYYGAHRGLKLNSRNLIEDPAVRPGAPFGLGADGRLCRVDDLPGTAEALRKAVHLELVRPVPA
ncbi:hypothetical protein [Amycolatopsis pigmentata]|uniref:Uncharacterized protein n=1 Tax=Amycolatopsis pigmentata TaxID=450801 RepID=A0ABW5G100_9PSEU